MLQAEINKIIDVSFVDGPGNRTAIFFQGCNFHCAYCHNPETICKCIHCGQCVPGCPEGALSIVDKKVKWNESLCIDCGKCYKECPYNATPRTHMMTTDEVMERVKKNQPFIRGITVSGGEASLQRDFVVELFTKARENDLSTLMDTNGGILLSEDEGLLEVTSGFMLDVKMIDPKEHHKIIKAPNDNVIKNLVSLAKLKKLTEIRTVVLANNPKSKETVEEVCKLLNGMDLSEVTYKLIRFRPIGVRGEAESWPVPTLEEMEEIKKVADQGGFGRVIIT